MVIAVTFSHISTGSCSHLCCMTHSVTLHDSRVCAMAFFITCLSLSHLLSASKWLNVTSDFHCIVTCKTVMLPTLEVKRAAEDQEGWRAIIRGGMP